MPLRPDTLTHAFADLVKKAGVPHVRLHDLRPTHATLMMEQGTNLKISVSAWDTPALRFHWTLTAAWSLEYKWKQRKDSMKRWTKTGTKTTCGSQRLAKCWLTVPFKMRATSKMPRFSYKITPCRSGEMVDAPVSKTGGGDPVSVRL